MKRVLFLVPLAAFIVISGCAGGTGGDDNPYEADTLSEARDIAEPLAEDWDADAFCFNVIGFIVDSDGVLLGPLALASEEDSWSLSFNDGGDGVFNVSVHYDGTYETSEDSTSDPCYPLPDYSDDHVRDLMNAADDAFRENLGEEDYVYMLNLQARSDSNTATIQGFNPDFTFAGWLVMDADTLDILDASWD